jgi:hypothetical protein
MKANISQDNIQPLSPDVSINSSSSSPNHSNSSSPHHSIASSSSSSSSNNFNFPTSPQSPPNTRYQTNKKVINPLNTITPRARAKLADIGRRATLSYDDLQVANMKVTSPLMSPRDTIPPEEEDIIMSDGGLLIRAASMCNFPVVLPFP